MNSAITDEKKIVEVEKQLLEAMQKSDIAILVELIHDDLLFVLPTGEVITKTMDLETHKSGNLILEEIVSSIDSINLINDNAVVTLTANIKGKMVGQNFEGKFRYIRVWKMFEGKLKIIAGSCVPI